MTTGYIYVLSNDDMPGLLKIGMTERSPEERAKQLFTTGVPSPFKVQRAVKVREPLKKEKKIHEILSEHRLPGREFFRVELKMVNNLFDLTEGTEWTDTEETKDTERTERTEVEVRTDAIVADRVAEALSNMKRSCSEEHRRELEWDVLMYRWIEQETEECETVTEFRTLYDYFTEWCVEVLGRLSNNVPDKLSFKKHLKKWQGESKFGLNYGKKKKEAGPNGYEANMLFNLKLI